ncbi:MAG TPA: hypothetical protein VI078_09910 [bacterium]
MKSAKKSDWNTVELPSARVTVTLGRTFTSQEMKKIRKGVIPEQMEDKWFVYWHNNTLFFHRSWTGFCVYVVRFADTGTNWSMVEADINRDPEQYTETSNKMDAGLISWLIDVLLLRQHSEYPSEESKDGLQPLKMWSLAGRAILGEHPEKE